MNCPECGSTHIPAPLTLIWFFRCLSMITLGMCYDFRHLILDSESSQSSIPPIDL
jgi:hypothetical protein